MRRRILLLVGGVAVLVVLAFAIPLAVLIRHNAYQDGLTSLQDETNNIALYLRGETTAPTAAQLNSYLKKLGTDRDASVQLLGADGTSASVVGTPPPGGLDKLPALGDVDQGPAGGGGRGGPGDGGLGPPQASIVAWAGGRLAQLQLPGPQSRYAIRVWASDDTLYSRENDRFLLLGGATIVVIVIGIAAGELLTRRIVRPLIDTAATAHRMSSGDVTARAPTEGPREIAEVGLALNRLGDRIDQLIAEERETVADLSHRLRTPLTALRLDAEALHDQADAERIGGHVSALERMLTAVIHAARRPQREGRMPSCDATAVVGERVAFWSALTEEQQRAATIELPSAPLVVRAGAEDLAATVDALLENVVAHTPEGAAFSVLLQAVPSGGRLVIADDGPGLPADAPVRGRSDRGSSGLGLDIARRCAEASGGSLTLGRSPSGGASITVELGAP